MKINKLSAMAGGERRRGRVLPGRCRGHICCRPKRGRGSRAVSRDVAVSPEQKTVRADVPLGEHATPVGGVQAVLGRWAQQVVCNAIIWGGKVSAKGEEPRILHVVTQGLGAGAPKGSSMLSEK